MYSYLWNRKTMLLVDKRLNKALNEFNSTDSVSKKIFLKLKTNKSTQNVFKTINMILKQILN